MTAQTIGTELSVDDAIGLFLDGLVNRGMRETSAVTQGYQLRRFFGSVLGEPLHTLSEDQTQRLNDELTEVRSQKTGALLASETVSLIRKAARRFTRWCVAQGRLSADPLAKEQKEELVRLHDEVDQLRADLTAMRKERDQLQLQLRSAGECAMSETSTIQPAPTLGTLVRDLREAAGLTRQQLQDQTNVAASIIRSFEMGRHQPSAWMLRRLMKSPAMVSLPELAEQAGLALDLGGSDTPKDGGPHEPAV